MPPKAGYGQEGPSNGNSPFNLTAFQIEQMLNRISTMKIVRVVAVTGGGPTASCYVDVNPLVAQIDGIGTGQPHGIIHDLPVFRLQGGGGALIIDPSVGDVGMMICSDRDISVVTNTRAPSLPGTFRKYDAADGVYFGLMS